MVDRSCRRRRLDSGVVVPCDASERPFEARQTQSAGVAIALGENAGAAPGILTGTTAAASAASAASAPAPAPAAPAAGGETTRRHRYRRGVIHSLRTAGSAAAAARCAASLHCSVAQIRECHLDEYIHSLGVVAMI